jgi:hypothetical protein
MRRDRLDNNGITNLRKKVGLSKLRPMIISTEDFRSGPFSNVSGKLLAKRWPA